MKSFLSALVFIVSLSSFAKEQKIMTITNDIDGNVVSISLDPAAEQFEGFHQVETTASGSIVKEAQYDLQQLFKGPTVHFKMNREVVKIRFNPNFDTTYGGSFVFDYLSSGITGTRQSVELDLRKNGQKWEVTMKNRNASKLHVVSKRLMGNVIGISKIEVK